jgi:hypothetical protein
MENGFRGTRVTDAGPLPALALRTTTTLGPIRCGLITPCFVRHPWFEARLELLRCTHEFVDVCENRGEFFGGEIAHRGIE